MRAEYWYANSAKFNLIIGGGKLACIGASGQIWGCFQTVKGMVGEICIELLIDNTIWYDVDYYYVNEQGQPKVRDGEMIKHPLSFHYNENVIHMKWYSVSIYQFEDMNFNKFRMIMDNLSVDDYKGEYPSMETLDGDVKDPYDDEDHKVEIIFVGTNPSRNWFDL